MIKTLNDFSLVDILPESLKNDSDVCAIAESLTPLFVKIYEMTSLVRLYDGIPDDLLDFVAYGEDVDYYDPSMTAEQKRTLISNAKYAHKIKGTVAAIENVVGVFFNNAKVVEWFEYGGDPYFFKIETDENFKSESDISKMFRMIESVKRKSTRLEGIWFKQGDSIYFKILKTDNGIHIKPVMKFYSGINMIGQSILISVGIYNTAKYGISGIPFSGALISGGSLLDSKTGTSVDFSLSAKQFSNSGSSSPPFSGELIAKDMRQSLLNGSIVELNANVLASTTAGDGIFDAAKIYAGQSLATVDQQNTGIASKISVGNASVPYCGKLYPAKGG